MIIKDIASILKKHAYLVPYLLLCITLAIVVVLFSRDIGLRAFDFIAENQDRELGTYLDTEGNYISKNVVETSSREDVKKIIGEKDSASLQTLFKAEAKRTGFTVFVATDANGISLSRMPINSNLGDNIFLAYPVGEATAEGDTRAVYGPGRQYPLIVGAGSLVKNEKGETQGSFMGGYWMDNFYAKYLKSKYFSKIRRQEIVFYSKEEGVTGDSFEDPVIKNKLRAYINHASALIQEGKSGELLNINGTDYVITNHLLYGDDRIYGGVLLLTPLMPLPFPVPLFLRSMVVSLIIAGIFLAGLLFLEKISIPKLMRFRNKLFYKFLIILTGIVFLSTWSGIYTYSKTTMISLDTPNFAIYNSTIKLYPGSGVYTKGNQQQVAVVVYSGGETINAVEAHLRFDPTTVRMDSISFNRSPCQAGTILEQKIDNSNGTVTISCAIVGGVSEDPRMIVADINFTPIKTGPASINFDEGTQVLAADGLGTNVLRSMSPGFYRIFEEKDMSGVFSKSSIVIPYSLSHENSSKWYSNKSISIHWPKIEGAEYVYEISKDATTTMVDPKVITTTGVDLTVPEDGIYYFKIVPQKDEQRGLMSTLKIMVDTTPPEVPTIRVSNKDVKKDEVVRFALDSSDNLSGLQKNFYISMDNSVWLPTFSKLYIPFQDVGEHAMGVRVFDNAENYSDASTFITVHR